MLGGGGTVVKMADFRVAETPLPASGEEKSLGRLADTMPRGCRLNAILEFGFVLDAGDWKRNDSWDGGGWKTVNCAPIDSFPSAADAGEAYAGGSVAACAWGGGTFRRAC